MKTCYLILVIALIKIIDARVELISLPSSENIEAIRLVGSGRGTSGRVELRVANSWGTVCNDKADSNVARVVCRMLGFGDSRGAVISRVYEPVATGAIWLDDVDCIGTESSLSSCTHRTFSSHNCAHNEDLAINCGTPYTAPSNVTAIRLVGGNETTGRVEVQMAGVWGTVCNVGMSNVQARVICRMLGLNPNHIRGITAVTPAATGPILLSNIICTGAESWLTNCIDYDIVNSRCTHRNDLSLSCGAGPSVDGIRLVGGTRTHGRVEIQLDGVWGYVCDDSFDRNNNGAAVVCRMLGLSADYARPVPNTGFTSQARPILLDSVVCMGSESSLTDCLIYTYQDHDCAAQEAVAVSCAENAPVITDYRLTLQGRQGFISIARFGGRLEVEINGTWGTVCDDNFDRNAAQVACRMLGRSPANPRFISSGGTRDLPILLDDLSCTGSESTLTACTSYSYGTNNCNHAEDVHLICNNPTPNITSIRLVGGNRTTGRVEIEMDGVWGTVCDDVIDSNANGARVVCRMLGFNAGMAEVVPHQFRPAPTGPILLDQVLCRGSEFDLLDCTLYHYRVNDCTHAEDVAVKCNE